MDKEITLPLAIQDSLNDKEAEAPAAFAPATNLERIVSIDTLRGVALLGILLVNISAFGLPENAYSIPIIAGGHTGLNLVFWYANQIFFENKMRALFSMLFGAGVVLLTLRAEERGGLSARGIYYRRTLWLVVFGLLHAYFIWRGDILYSYGVVGLTLFPLRKLRPAALLAAGALLLMILLGYGIGGTINALSGYYFARSGFDPVKESIAWILADEPGRLLVTGGHIGLVMLIVKSGWLKRLTSRLAAVGQMALTCYLATSLICTTIFEGYGFGLFAKLQRYQLLYVVFSVWLFLLIASPLWLRHFRFGPMEWVWRSLTYWRKQPIKIAVQEQSQQKL